MRDQPRQGQDVIFMQSNNEPLPGKIIRPSDQGSTNFHLVIFDDSAPNGTRLQKSVQYSETPRANHFTLLQEGEGTRSSAAGQR